jgi:tRNA pseudouridine13 synthase
MTFLRTRAVAWIIRLSGSSDAHVITTPSLVGRVPEEARGPPEADRAVGLDFYLSRAPGAAGRTKATWEEFRVTEISNYPLPDPDGAYTVLRVRSGGWEQHELGAAIARELRLPGRSVQWSGTKDRRAAAERLLSYRGAPPAHGLSLPRVELLEAYRARDGLVLGHHYGNAFRIRVSELRVPPSEAVAAYRAVESELRAAGGFPNLFGRQRFGEVRPITHEVGRWVVRGDLARAVDVYLTALPATAAPGVGDAARAAYAEHRDAARALREFPPEYRFERQLLERLARGDPPERAFRALSHDLRLLFVHAFQAYLFNRWLTVRHAAGAPLDRPVEGDRVLRLGRDGTVRSQEGVPVAADNLAECTDLVVRGRGLVAGPLVGYATTLEGRPGTWMQQVLADEEVGTDGFRAPAAPEVASAGAWRPILLPLPPIGLEPDGAGVAFAFALPKGAYATVLLREFLKSADGPSPPASGAEPTNTGAPAERP